MNAARRLAHISAALLLATAACESSPTEQRLISVPAVTLEAVGDARQLEATLNGTEQLPVWESLDPLIATVTRAGMVTAVAPGIAKVRARLGSKAREGTVTVMPAVSVEITSATVERGPSGEGLATVWIRNRGGRGFYRMRFYRASTVEGAMPEVVSQDITDQPIVAGQPEFYSMRSMPAGVQWIVVYSREPNSLAYRITACHRLDGATDCPMQ